MTSKEYWEIYSILSLAAHYAFQDYKNAASYLDELSKGTSSPIKSIADTCQDMAKKQDEFVKKEKERHERICHLQEVFLQYEHLIINEYYI